MSASTIILSFFENLRQQSKGIVIDELDDEMLKKTTDLAKRKILDEMDEKEMADLKTKYQLDLLPTEKELFVLSSTSLEWSRPEKKEKEGFIRGGFSFNGIHDLAKFNTAFWDKSMEMFEQAENRPGAKMSALKALRWFESPSPRTDPSYTPQFGCIKLKKGKGFPTEYYFYDSGLLFALPFRSYVEYVEALTNSAAVTCWQYFYVEPEEIISKNGGLNYITWSLHTLSNLEPGIGEMNFNKNIKSDRLDLILEYLERCVRLLPSSFPFLDFTHHKKHYEEIRKAYLKQKKK